LPRPTEPGKRLRTSRMKNVDSTTRRRRILTKTWTAPRGNITLTLKYDQGQTPQPSITRLTPTSSRERYI
jgi:hypothetical protein